MLIMPDERRDFSPVTQMLVGRLDAIDAKLDKLSVDQVERVTKLETRQETHGREIGSLQNDVDSLKSFRSNLRGQLAAAAAGGGLLALLAQWGLKVYDTIPH